MCDNNHFLNAFIEQISDEISYLEKHEINYRYCIDKGSFVLHDTHEITLRFETDRVVSIMPDSPAKILLANAAFVPCVFNDQNLADAVVDISIDPADLMYPLDDVVSGARFLECSPKFIYELFNSNLKKWREGLLLRNEDLVVSTFNRYVEEPEMLQPMVPPEFSLNEEQLNALSRSLSPGVSLIWGPPGTGKTRVISISILNAILEGKKVLLVSNTNKAVDHVLENLFKLCHNSEILADYLKNHKLLRVPEIRTSENKHLNQYFSLRHIIAQHDLRDHGEKLIQQSLLVATTLTLACIKKAIVQEQFDCVYIDEISMCSLPMIYFACSAAISTIVLAGDPCQLQPIANFESLKTEFFSYLGIPNNEDVSFVHLNKQYRFPIQIMDIVNGMGLYPANYQLINGNENQHDYSVVQIIDTSDVMPDSQQIERSQISSYNAFCDFSIVNNLLEQGYECKDIAIITRFRAQADLLRALKKNVDKYKELVCATIHQMQGDEKKVIIYDVPESMEYDRSITPMAFGNTFLENEFNVVLTRAKEKLLFVSNIYYIRTNGKRWNEGHTDHIYVDFLNQADRIGAHPEKSLSIADNNIITYIETLDEIHEDDFQVRAAIFPYATIGRIDILLQENDLTEIITRPTTGNMPQDQYAIIDALTHVPGIMSRFTKKLYSTVIDAGEDTCYLGCNKLVDGLSKSKFNIRIHFPGCSKAIFAPYRPITNETALIHFPQCAEDIKELRKRIAKENDKPTENFVLKNQQILELCETPPVTIHQFMNHPTFALNGFPHFLCDYWAFFEAIFKS